MNENVKIVFGLLGGLALFLYGMNGMSDALQKTAGDKMKKILSFLTKNPIMGALAGALVTAVLQSSSATTVMVIGFVSAGLMSLPQAISVIFGANIGTTMTAQLMAFKISDYIYPLIFIGFMMNFVCKKEQLKNIGLVIFSFGLLFEGIEIMGSVMKPLAGSAIFVDLMAKVKEIPILGVALGTIMTLVVQSSSATIAVLQNFASQAGPDGVTSIMGLTGAIPILLGDNIGTTITALLASIGQSKNAKRTALAHSVFNITGSILFLFLLPILARFVQFISPKGNEVDVISRQIANAHTTFNVVCTLIWLPLIPVMVRIVMTIIPGKDKKTDDGPASVLEDGVIAQPAAALYLVSEELGHMAEVGSNLLTSLKGSFSADKASSEKAKEQYKMYRRQAARMESDLSTYVTKMLSSGNLTQQQSGQAAGLLYVSNNIGRIADRCEEIADVHDKILMDKRSFSDAATGELQDCIEISRKLFDRAIRSVKDGDLDRARTVVKKKNKMRKAQKQLKRAHLARVNEGLCDASMTEDYSAIMYSLDRIVDNCVSIAEETLDHIAFVNLTEDEQTQKSDQAVSKKVSEQSEQTKPSADYAKKKSQSDGDLTDGDDGAEEGEEGTADIIAEINAEETREEYESKQIAQHDTSSHDTSSKDAASDGKDQDADTTKCNIVAKATDLT